MTIFPTIKRSKLAELSHGVLITASSYDIYIKKIIIIFAYIMIHVTRLTS